MRRALVLSTTLVASAFVMAQGDDMPIRDDVPIETYLSLLAQVAVPAREGAQAYMSAFRSRCGRPLSTIELRRAFADGAGDATLMGMIRASQQKDTATIARLGAAIHCPRS
jgi:hypothetical protein